MSWLFIGPPLLAGIGQVTKKYSNLLQNSEYVIFGDVPSKSRYAIGFTFVLPIQQHVAAVERYATLCDKMIYMTVCETEPVNPSYEILTKFKTIYCPSEFSRNILAKQFPKAEWKLLHHWASEAPHKSPSSTTPYTFYTIGNILDPRKNIMMLIDAFLACEFRDAARLVLKATCKAPVDWKVPGVVIINGLLDDDAMERVHASCHCYVNCSHSEGVGMGAVEAALRSKPVIIPEYGGLKEYVETPWILPCTKEPVGFDDFLFTRDLEWGSPSKDQLINYLWDCFERKITHWDHSHTRRLVADVKPTLLRFEDACQR
jgi:glycosyltransferase involved in cell wall biosynthesis